MTLDGTVLNGVVVFDGAAKAPEGARVRVDFELEDADDIGAPPEPYDPERDLALLRDAVEDVKAGRTRPFDEAMAEMAARHNFSWPPQE